MRGQSDMGAAVVAATIVAAPLGAGQRLESQIPYERRAERRAGLRAWNGIRTARSTWSSAT
jgi:hypothetical protein